jgi:hypothetical protein
VNSWFASFRFDISFPRLKIALKASLACQSTPGIPRWRRLEATRISCAHIHREVDTRSLPRRGTIKTSVEPQIVSDDNNESSETFSLATTLPIYDDFHANLFILGVLAQKRILQHEK